MRPVKFTANNTVTLLHNGAEFFPALIAAADAAQNEIFLETYIFALDETGALVKAALIRAAARGVTVNVIIDWLGTGRTVAPGLAAEFQAQGVHCRVFNPWFKRGIARTHRKIVVIDGKLALVGGLNINDDLRDDADPDHILPAARWDMATHITGPLAAEVHRESVAQWLRLGPLKLTTRWKMFRYRRAVIAPNNDGPMLAGLVVRDNLRNRRTIQRSYLKALGGARKSALLANPYFAPGRKLRDALAKAAQRGVKVTLLLGVGQFHMQDVVARSYYAQLLAAGVQIVEYRKTQLHGKVAVVDNDWASVGSSNYDGLSLFVNQEANVVVKDRAFCQALRAHIEAAVRESVPVEARDYADISWLRRLWYGGASLVYKNIVRILSQGKSAE